MEIVRAAYEAVARRDRDALGAIVTEHLAPDFEFEALLTGLTYKGAAGARELVDDIQDTVGYTGNPGGRRSGRTRAGRCTDGRSRFAGVVCQYRSRAPCS